MTLGMSALRGVLFCAALAGCAFQPTDSLVGGADAAVGSVDGRIDGATVAPDGATVSPDGAKDPGTSDAGVPGTADAPAGDPPATNHHFVTSSLRIGSTTTEAASYAFDLDNGDGPDNALGFALAGLSSQLDIDAALAGALQSGSQVILHSVRAEDLSAAPLSQWRVYRGQPQASPDLSSGNGSFTVASNARLDSVLVGSIAGGTYTGFGVLVVELTLGPGTPPFAIQLVSARLEARIDAGSCSGRIGGAVTAEYLDAEVLPAVAVALDAQIAADGSCRQDYEACSSSSRTILTFFDADGDRVITAGEVRSNILVRVLLTPDVDVLDATGDHGQDGVRESVSLAFGFDCVRATFSAPWEN
jgi:hypothetical protein